MSRISAPIPASTRFGRLTVVAYHTALRSYCECICDCGAPKRVLAASLKSGRTKSCGCGNTGGRPKHGHARDGARSAEYNAWQNMLARCCKKDHPSFPGYGGRGISVCAEWTESFERFLSDMGPRPPGTSLDRIDVNGGYCKGNCRWADWKTQCENRRPKQRDAEMQGRAERSRDLARAGFPVEEIADWLGISGKKAAYALRYVHSG